jgi:hypothetical protein
MNKVHGQSRSVWTNVSMPMRPPLMEEASADICIVPASHMAAIDRIEDIVRLERIECNFQRIDGYLIRREGDGRELDSEYDAGDQAGDLRPVSDGVRSRTR